MLRTPNYISVDRLPRVFTVPCEYVKFKVEIPQVHAFTPDVNVHTHNHDLDTILRNLEKHLSVPSPHFFLTDVYLGYHWVPVSSTSTKKRCTTCHKRCIFEICHKLGLYLEFDRILRANSPRADFVAYTGYLNLSAGHCKFCSPLVGLLEISDDTTLQGSLELPKRTLHAKVSKYHCL